MVLEMRNREISHQKVATKWVSENFLVLTISNRSVDSGSLVTLLLDDYRLANVAVQITSYKLVSNSSFWSPNPHRGEPRHYHYCE